MAELHLTDIDDQVLARLRQQVEQEGTSLKEQVRSLLEQAAESTDGSSEEPSQTLCMPPSDRSFRNVDPVDAPGISASKLLIRDRRR